MGGLSDPLSLSPDSVYFQFFKHRALVELVHTDVVRTHADLALFADEETRRAMERILIVHALHLPEVLIVHRCVVRSLLICLCWCADFLSTGLAVVH